MFLSLPGSLPLVLSFERIPPALVRASFIFCQSVDAMDNFPQGYGVCGSARFFPTACPLLRFLGILPFIFICFCSRSTTPYGKAKADVTWLVLLFCLSRFRILMEFVFSRSCFFVLFLSFLGLVLVNRCQIAMEELGARIVFLSSQFVYASVHLSTFWFWESFAVFLAVCIALLAK